MSPEAEPPANTIHYRRVIDLSHPIHPGIPRWPGDPPVEFEDAATIARDGFFLRRFSLGEHTGTHLNAPGSFHLGGLSVDAIPTGSLVVPAVVMDVRRRVEDAPGYLLTVADIRAWEAEHGPVPPNAAVLLQTGWDAKWDSPGDYLGVLDAGGMTFPGFGLDAAQFLTGQRQIAGIGIDTAGVDGGQDQTFAVNSWALSQPRTVLENLTNLDQLPPVGTVLVVGVLRLLGGSGSPAAVLALAP